MLDVFGRAAAFTGHRNIEKSEYDALAKRLFLTVDALYREGVYTYYCGGALGFDTVAAVTVLNMKAHYPHLRLVMAIPCPEQSAYWSAADKALYESILRRADECVTLSPHYTRDCMMKRNRYMVDHAELLIAYVKRETGGSAATRRYAQKKGLTILDLTE